MEVTTLILSPLDTNCYIVKTSDTTAVVIDPADNAKKIAENIAAMGLRLSKILLTHGHFDHTCAAAELKKIAEKAKKGEEKPHVPIYINDADKPLLSDPIGSFAYFMPKKEFSPLTTDESYKNGDEVKDGNVTFKVLGTPGHTEGSVCLFCEGGDGEKVLFSGDTLFKDSIGRSDGTGGSSEKLMESLKLLNEYDDSYIVYPRHGPKTTLGAEKRFNPFLSGIV